MNRRGKWRKQSGCKRVSCRRCVRFYHHIGSKLTLSRRSMSIVIASSHMIGFAFNWTLSTPLSSLGLSPVRFTELLGQTYPTSDIYPFSSAETPELELFEWQVKCATHCKRSTEGQYEAEVASLKAIKAAHTTLVLVHKELSVVRAMAEAGHIERDAEEAEDEEEDERRALEISEFVLPG